MTKDWRKYVYCLTLAGLVTGCSGTVLESQRATYDPRNDVSGGYYFLPKGKVILNVKLTTENELSVSLKQTVYEPDPRHFYLLNYEGSSGAHDKVTVTLTNQLLDKITVDSDEKSDEIIVKLVELGKEVAKIGAAFPAAEAKDVSAQAFDVDVAIDPTSQADEDWFNSHFKGIVRLDVSKPDVSKFAASQTQSDPSSTSNEAIYDTTCNASLCFRPALPYKLELFTDTTKSKSSPHPQPTVLASFTAMLPNEAPVLGLDVTRAAFVKKVTTVDFDNGVFKEIAIDKPSSTLAFVEIPLSIAKAILSVPAEIVQLKIDTTKSAKDLHDARTAELEARQKLIEAQEDFLESQRERLRNQSNGSNPFRR